MTAFDPLGSPDLPCNLFVELVTDYLDGAMSDHERVLVEEHLATCPGCATVLAQWRVVIRLTGRLADDEVDLVDPAVQRSLIDAFRRARPS